MGLEARMQAVMVQSNAGGQWVPCYEEEPGAHRVEEVASNYYGVVGWLRDTEFVRRDDEAKGSETIELVAVSVKDKADPNRQWAEATPSGKLTMNIQNPGAFGYIKAGSTYRVTIEKIRGPIK